MTKGETNLLYVEIDKLLNDICQFLNEEIKNGFISPKGRSLANILIERSKQQLQTISKSTIFEVPDTTSESYVDMQACKGNLNNEYPENEVYSDVIEQVSNHSSTDEACIVCPHSNLAAGEAKEGKCGNLYRKDKILFFEQHKKVYAAVFQSWLLIYMNENASKPCQTFDLKRYEAKPPSTILKDIKKREESFNLISNVDSKSYHFTALTSKDMIQWVAAINQHVDYTVTKRSLPPVPDNDSIDDISTGSNNDYEPLKEYRLTQPEDPKEFKPRTSNVEKKPLPLPPRNTKPKKVQPPIPRKSSESSLSSNYDSVGPGVVNSSHDDNSHSFSDDDSDMCYDNPTDLRQATENFLNKKLSTGNNIRNQNNMITQEDEDNIYDSLQNPNEASHPNSFKSRIS